MAHLLVTVTNVPMAVLFYDLFKVVDRRLALLDVFFTLVGTAIEAAGLLNQFAPLVLPGGASATSALATTDYDIYTVFYGFDIVCVAYLVFRSTFLPRTIGVLLAVDGLAYLIHSVTDVLAPGFAAHVAPWIDLPAPVGEGSLCLWLLVVGVNAERWSRRADPSTAAVSRGQEEVSPGRGARSGAWCSASESRSRAVLGQRAWTHWAARTEPLWTVRSSTC
jgi:hypothetical protein